MDELILSADPDPRLWIAVPNAYPDDGGSDPGEWARGVAAEHEPDDGLLARLLENLARRELGRDGGMAYVYLPGDGAPMQLARLRAVLTETLGEEPASPLAPAEDVYEAQWLGPAIRQIVAGRARQDRDDLLVTVVYRWTLDWMSVLLTMSVLDPAEAVRMIGPLDRLADSVLVEEPDGTRVVATLIETGGEVET